MIAYALACGALLGALFQLSPWSATLALPLFLGLPRALRPWFGLAFLLILIRVLTLGNGFAGEYGHEQVLQGGLHRGILYSRQGPIYLDYYPQIPDGWARVEGRIEHPEAARNPGGFNQAIWLHGLGVRAVLKVGHVQSAHPGETRLKHRVRDGLLRGLNTDSAALAVALTLGERKALGADQKAFQRAGLAHVLALSGLHVGILAGFLVLLLFLLGRFRYLAALGLLIGYVWLVGDSPSLLRATLMVSLVLVGFFLGKGRVSLPQALALAFTVHLALTPYALFSLSFQLSYLALGGIALIMPVLPRVSGWAGYLLDGLLITLSAQALLIPLILSTFHFLPLLSPLANLLGLPIVTVLVPLGFMKASLALVLPGAAVWLAPPYNLLAGTLLWLVRILAHGPQLDWGSVAPAGFALYYLGLLAVVLALYQYIEVRQAALLLAIIVMAAVIPVFSQRADLWQLDVGEGDSSILRLPGDVGLLVDGGRSWAGNKVVNAARALGLRGFALVIATHPDANHEGGLPYVIEHFLVGALVLGPKHPSNPLEAKLFNMARRKDIPIIRESRGGSLALDGTTLRFLGPGLGVSGNDNQDSLVFMLDWRGRRVLFTGDNPQGEKVFWSPKFMDVFKVGHRDSGSSTGKLLLQRFQQRIALIGAGQNTYSHPNPQREGALHIQLW